MTFRRILLAVASVAAFSVSASAQTLPTAKPFRSSSGQPQDGLGVTIIAPIAATSTSTAGTIATANTYQSALSANSDRLGCALYNTSTAVELVFLGAPGGATAARSIPIPAGGSFNCGSFQGLVLTDQISITSATAAATFVVVSQ